MLRAEKLTMRYGDRCVLDVDSLEIGDGGTHVLVGHNGSGKTTLLRVLARLDAPTAGSIATDLDRRHIILCLQHPYMFRGTVERNVAFGVRARNGRGAGEARLDDIMARLRLEDFRRRDARTLSAGEMQRVAIARALACAPRLLLLDEPTANLDPESAAIIEAEIRARGTDGGSTVVATHMPELAVRLGADVLRLERGRLVHPELTNVFEGVVARTGDVITMRVGKGLTLRCATDRSGLCRAAIPASDIVLSRQPLDSSMTNSFQGHVTGVRLSGEAVEVTVDIGLPLRVLVTRTSVDRLGIAVGGSINVSFKATAVRVY
jgi:tungstate transport system ATP-binding protein